MTGASVLARGRAAAEALMVDQCVITTPGLAVTDDLTGQVSQPEVVRYRGACRIQAPAAQGLQADAGDVTVTVLRMQLQVPVAGTELVARGDWVVITASAGDGALVGRRWVVRDLAHKTHATARRLTIEEVT